MSKAVIKMPCTDASCKHNHEVMVDLEELGIHAHAEPPQATVTPVNTIQMSTPTTIPQQQEKQLTHDDVANMLPKGTNFTKCTGEGCGKKIKNKKFTTKFKTCTDCGANTVPKGKKYCPTCGKDEPEDEPFEDSDVELEESEEDGD